MRWLLVLVAACGAPAKSASPTLEPDPPPPPKPAGPPSFEVEFAVPTTTPSGNPIKVTAFVPSPGVKRLRKLDSLFTVDQELEGTRFEQRSEHHFVLDEEIVEVVDTTIKKLQVNTILAQERVEVRGVRSAQGLLEGQYTLAPADRGLRVSHKTGRDVGSREIEELTTLYGDQVGVPYAPNVVVATKALRLGESIKLPDDDLRRLGAETDVTLTLVALDGNIATYQFLAVTSMPDAFSAEGIEHIGTKAQLAFEISTGRVIRSQLVDLRVVEKRASKRTERTMTLEYR